MFFVILNGFIFRGHETAKNQNTTHESEWSVEKKNSNLYFMRGTQKNGS